MDDSLSILNHKEDGEQRMILEELTKTVELKDKKH